MRKIKNKCPFCGKTVKRLIKECNGFCECGAKYYFQDKIWLDRNTGEKIKEERLYKIIYGSPFGNKSIIIGAKNATEALEKHYQELISYDVKSIEEYEMGE